MQGPGISAHTVSLIALDLDRLLLSTQYVPREMQTVCEAAGILLRKMVSERAVVAT